MVMIFWCYDMHNDPAELRNLWAVPDFAGLKQGLLADLQAWSSR